MGPFFGVFVHPLQQWWIPGEEGYTEIIKAVFRGPSRWFQLKGIKKWLGKMKRRNSRKEDCMEFNYMINMRKIGIVRDNVRSISLGDIFKISHLLKLSCQHGNGASI